MKRISFRRIILLSLIALHLHPSLRAEPTQAQKPAPRIGVALSGGGARGAAHIGVLKVLEQQGIQIHFMAGTSFGAVVAAFYALGYSTAEMEKIFSSQDWNQIFSDSPDRRLSPVAESRSSRYLGELPIRDNGVDLPTGLWEGQNLIEVFNHYTTAKMLKAEYDFDRLRIPLRIVASDLITGDPYIFRDGSMSTALRASIALPLVFTPVEKDHMLLVDGGLVNDLPTDIVRQMGADVVIAIDVSSPLLKKDQIKTFVDVIDQAFSIQMKQTIERNLKFADIVVRPDLEGFSYSDYARVNEISRRGEAAARQKLPELSRLVMPTAPQTSASPAASTDVYVDSVVFDGLRTLDAGDLLREVSDRSGTLVNVATLRDDLSRLYATRRFDFVDYHLEPLQNNRYRLHYRVREAPLRTMGASLRYDRDYKFVALAELNLRNLLKPSLTGTLSSQFGGLENHTASLRYVPSHLPFVFLEPQTYYRRRERRDMRDEVLVDTYTDKRGGSQFMIGSTILPRSEISAGYRFDGVHIVGGTPPNQEPTSRNVAGLRMRFSRDTLDSTDFPNYGNLISLQADKSSTEMGSDFSFWLWQGDGRVYFPVSSGSAIGLRGGVAFARGDLPFYERVYLGGYSFSEGASRHLLGYQRDELVARHAVWMGASFRRQFYSRPLSAVRRAFLYGEYNVAGLSNRESSPYRFNFFNGAGAGLFLDTIAGPLRILGAWGEGGRGRFYLSLGPAF